ncbi:cell division protein FtsJ [Cohnella ginsengisoli]|uniref:Cell division protein FtsJ n=1 Tax=Cohnella ginsengisoli TaxID=425004 RepID=A0A9X4QKD1_9BACL|nr:cyclic-phosphate processing receiver domain-containing protein [Cohnella ginsengisoli]MDG0789558.1 cell division protein FtsJ [Cohnella ginsengisoli]
MINVYLDDVRPCPAGFVPARTAEECLLLLRECEVDILSLDYELGYGHPNGFAVVAGLIAAGTFPREVYVHSSSMMGRAQMVRGLREAGIAGLIVHDGPMPPSVLEAAAKGAKTGKDESP